MTLCHVKTEYFEGILKTKTVLDAGKAWRKCMMRKKATGLTAQSCSQCPFFSFQMTNKAWERGGIYTMASVEWVDFAVDFGNIILKQLTLENIWTCKIWVKC